MAKNEVVIKFLGDASQYEKVSNQVVVKTDSLGKKIAGVFGGIGAAAATRKVFEFGQTSIAAFKDAEQSQARLDDAFEKFPKLADSNAAAFQRLDDAQAKKTKFDDDATKSGQAVLAQFGLTGKEILKMTPLLQDYAAKTGKDLPTAAIALGKAMLGNGKALKAVGINFVDTKSAAGNLKEIMGGLQSQVGGFAEKEGKTAAGRAEILKNQFGELQETVGQKLLPVLSKLTAIGLGIVNWFSQLSPGVQTAIGVIIGLVGAAFLITKAVQAWTAVQAALNVVMDMNPIVLVVVAIAALVAGVILAYQHCETFRNIVQAAWDVIKGVASFLVDVAVGAFDLLKGAISGAFNFVRDHWPLLLAILTGPFGLAVLFITQHFDTIVGFVKGLPGKIASAASGMWDGIKNAFRSAINWIIDKWNGLSFTLPSVSAFGVKIGGFTLSTPNIPRLHSGGVFHASGGEGLALLRDGEQVLTPEQQAGFGGITVIVQTGQVLATSRDVSNAVVDALESHFGHGGAVGNRRGQFLRPA